MTELIFLFILLILSGFFSSSEIAFIVSNKAKLHVQARKKVFGAATALSLANSTEKYLSTVLVGNNVVNIAFSSIAAITLQSALHASDSVILLLISFVILIFGELIPKSLIRVVADAAVLYAAVFIQASHFLLYPLIWLTQNASALVVALLGREKRSVGAFFHKRDFEILLEESEDVGVVGKEERQKLAKVITLSDVLAKEVMKPRPDIVAVEKKTPVREVLRVLIEHGYSKLLVYEHSIDNMVGVVYARDFLARPRSLTHVLHDVLFIPETKNCSDLFREFRLKNISLAVVIDEFGGTAGIVTSEDILEEFLGDIHDEYDDEESGFRKMPDGSLLISGKYEVKKLRDEHMIQLPDGPFDTVAGFIIHYLGRIPVEKEEFLIGRFHFQVIRATRTKIEFVKLRIGDARGRPQSQD